MNNIDILGKTETDKFLDGLSKEFGELDNKYIDDVASVNENPWLSEGLRSKKVAQLQEKYQAKRDALTDRLTLFKDVQNKRTAITEVGNRKVLVDLDTGKIIKELGESFQKEDTQIIEAGGRRLLVNAQTGKIIQDFGAVTRVPTEGDIETGEIPQIQDRLNASRGIDGKVDPNVYIREKQTARIGPDEFDKRFKTLLSPQERINLGIDKSETEIESPF